jgi:hypothetical protein
MTQQEKDTQLGAIVREHREARDHAAALRVKIERAIRALRVAATAADDFLCKPSDGMPSAELLAVADVAELPQLLDAWGAACVEEARLAQQRAALGA